MQNEGYLILQNGKVFRGELFGADAEAMGELVFTTAMTGYLETLTDPSYYEQIVIQTFPLIGNYGIIPEDFESQAVRLKGYIVREWCQVPSNFRSEGGLDAFLKQQGVVGLCGIDTRALTRIVREHGVMNARISKTANLSESEKQELLQYEPKNAVLAVSRTQKEVLPCPNAKYRVALWDFGAKGNIATELVQRGCEVTILPATTTAAEIAAMRPDGILLSNGPGDPTVNTSIIEQVRILCKERIPTFGICLGHQLLALSQGATTTKLKYGHRGANQPAKDLESGRVYITSQNHGYAVDASSLPKNIKMSFQNVNDGTCEGVQYLDLPAFTVQFHPEACAGPHDTAFLFDRFITLMQEGK